jgi:hypothetical protein
MTENARPPLPGLGEWAVGYGGHMSQITDSVSSLAQDLSETVVSLAQDVAAKATDAAVAAGDKGRGLGKQATEVGAVWVDTAQRKLQDKGVLAKPKRSKKPFLVLLLLIVGGAVAYKLLKGRSTAAPTSFSPETDRLTDNTGVSVG